jgi:2-polyprenyl-6-methoxyphenol hydroxylase-like FAD-dependent oxidoreductase
VSPPANFISFAKPRRPNSGHLVSTATQQLSEKEEMAMTLTRKPGHALVIGGSIVGSAVAAMLATRFEHVTVIERDALPETPDVRAGVPQGRHVHALLARGATELERLFPGFVDAMVEGGAKLLDVGRDVAWLTPAGWGVPFESGLVLCCGTRNLIEWEIRRRSLSHSNVTLRDMTAVTGLLFDATSSRVTGVRVRSRRTEGPVDTLMADLIVDTSGRGSQLPEWLTASGRPQVREIVIDAHMAYASRFFAIDQSALRGWGAAYVQPALPHSRCGGILFPVESGRYLLPLFGYGGAAPPTDEDGFVRFIEGLRSSILADILRHAAPLTPIVGHRRTANRWRRYDEMSAWPEGLVAAGDSVCCFDPVYGQGMTTGILGALRLMSRLDAESGVGRPGFARRVQREMVSVVRPAWNLATGEDLRLDTTSGGRLCARDRWLQRYVDRVIAASTSDTAVRQQLLSVMNMVSGPEALLHPMTVARVAGHICWRRRTTAPLWPPVTSGSQVSAIDQPAIHKRPGDRVPAGRGSWA